MIKQLISEIKTTKKEIRNFGIIIGPILLIIGAIAGTVLAVVVVNSGMEEYTDADGNKFRTSTYKKFDSSVEGIMADWFMSPPPITEHGKNVDRVIVFVHAMMAVLLVGWTLYFLGAGNRAPIR